METKNDSGLFWLHLICCGGPLIIIALVSLAPMLIAFVLTYKVWLLAAGASVALVGALVWWRRLRRTARLNSPSSNPQLFRKYN